MCDGVALSLWQTVGVWLILPSICAVVITYMVGHGAAHRGGHWYMLYHCVGSTLMGNIAGLVCIVQWLMAIVVW